MKSSPAVNASEFNPGRVNLGSSFLLTGGDAYLNDTVLDGLKKRMVSAFAADLVILYGDDLQTSELNDQLDTMSIFSNAKLLIIRNADKMEKKQLEVLADYFNSPSEIQSLAIVADKTDQRMSSWKSIYNGCQVIQCDPPRLVGALRSWLEMALTNTHKTMTPKAKEVFANRVEMDYSSAANELAKLDILTGKRGNITEEDVMKSLGTSRSGTLIDFFRALGNRSAALALEAMGRMLAADWEPLQVFFQIQKFFTIIWKIQALRSVPLAEGEIIGKHLNELYQSQRKEFFEFSKKYHIKMMDSIFSILLETDAQLKYSSANPEILLTNGLLQVLQV